jgi:hypothetical protein
MFSRPTCILLSLYLSINGLFSLSVFGRSHKPGQSSTQKRTLTRTSKQKRLKMRGWHSRNSQKNPSRGDCLSKRASRSERQNPFTSQALEALLTKAKAQGFVRIIIGLDVTFVPVGNLPNPQAAQAQRRAIRQAQDALLESLLACKFIASSIKRFDTIPFIAMSVNAAALKYLNASTQVKSIEEDVVNAPMSG